MGLRQRYGDIELWAQDEARLGLIPITRKAWAPIGERPVANLKRRYEWVYLYAFVQPATGHVEWLIFPTVNTELFEIALDLFAKAIGAGSNKHIVLVLDQAGWHTAKHLTIPQGIHLLFQPSHTPEVQPAEHLWPWIREALANDWIGCLDQLETRLIERCQVLNAQPESIQSLTHFDWWKQIEELAV
jgi:hypothetical protein